MFTPIELQLIEKEMQSKSAADISFLLDAPVDAVKQAIKEISIDKDIPTKQAAIDEKLEHRKAIASVAPKKVRARKLKKPKAPKVISRIIERPAAQPRRRETPKGFSTKAVDYSKKKMVQVAKGTWVYIEDPQQLAPAKEKYFQNIKTKSERNSEDTNKMLGRVAQLNSSLK